MVPVLGDGNHQEANDMICFKPKDEPLDDPYGWRQHDKVDHKHSGRFGHYCDEWDGLWICADCTGEFKHCKCFTPTEILTEEMDK